MVWYYDGGMTRGTAPESPRLVLLLDTLHSARHRAPLHNLDPSPTPRQNRLLIHPSHQHAALMQVAPGERLGSYVLDQLVFRGHSMEFCAEIDRYSSAEALVRLATVSCMCCSGGEP